eukprot:Tbor_TRINITY_DN3092_c0_g1::TRINITY_DN3092_c0_g1_i1::g.17294::m.17294/K01648/ACLY; ATP citrate (pro-S)-lyase
MARKKIREYVAKRLLKDNHRSLPESFQPIQVCPTTDWLQLREDYPWLLVAKLVVKPDMLFGQRGKHDLVALNISFDEAEAFVKGKIGQIITVGTPGVTDVVTHFIIERFVSHDNEYYLSIQCHRDFTSIELSHKGGINVEENWDSLKKINVPLGDVPVLPCDDFMKDFGSAATPMWRFVLEVFRVFEDLDFTMMEFNPLCMVEEKGENLIIPLDMRAELDDTAAFKNLKKWEGIGDFPRVFGHRNCEAEDKVVKLDSQTGASLKLSIINPAGRMWLLVAGGGASVIYTDTVVDLGYGETLGNYGEYSGNPTDEDTYQYTCCLLKVATRLDDECPHKGRCLLIGGGIANFTDVKATFTGIIRALLQYANKLQAAEFHIFVRRGGPNYDAALKMMKEIELGLGVTVSVFGPDTPMTRVVHLAADKLKIMKDGGK